MICLVARCLAPVKFVAVLEFYRILVCYVKIGRSLSAYDWTKETDRHQQDLKPVSSEDSDQHVELKMMELVGQLK